MCDQCEQGGRPAAMGFVAPDASIVADHTWPDGTTTSVRKDWIGEEWKEGRRTLIITHTNPDGTLRRRTVWTIGVVYLKCLGHEPHAWPP